MVQWVHGTTTLGGFVVGKSGSHRKEDYRFHYYPHDISPERARECMQNARDPSKPQLPGNTSRLLNERLLYAFREVCNNYHPIMELRLMEAFPSAQEW